MPVLEACGGHGDDSFISIVLCESIIDYAKGVLAMLLPVNLFMVFT